MVQNDEAVVAKRRGRPPAFDRGKALAAMRAVFWAKGFAGASLDDLSAATGMNRPSLYNAFGDKAEAFKTVLTDYAEDVRPRYTAAFQAPGRLSEVLAGVYEVALSIYRSDADQGLGCFMLGAALTDSVRDDSIAATILDYLHEMDRGFGWRLKKAVAEGELRPDADVRSLAMLAATTHNTLAIRVRAGETDATLRAYVAQMVGIIAAWSVPAPGR